MSGHFVSRGFVGKRRTSGPADRVPPGQHVVDDFPVLSAGPTPSVPLDTWTFSLEGKLASPRSWSWAQFQALASGVWTVDIHCVTKWTKLDTRWTGVSVETLLEGVELDPGAAFVQAFSDGGYTTNFPLPDILNGQGFIATSFDGRPLAPEHGGPARLVVPHLYFWKSAKWVRGLRFMEDDRRGFWESLGYQNHGDPWKEERYDGD